MRSNKAEKVSRNSPGLRVSIKRSSFGKCEFHPSLGEFPVSLTQYSLKDMIPDRFHFHCIGGVLIEARDVAASTDSIEREIRNRSVGIGHDLFISGDDF